MQSDTAMAEETSQGTEQASRGLDAARVKEAARGRWISVLETLAPPLAAACGRVGKHVPCPVHGGKDGFRLFPDAAETGGGICNSCGDLPDGFNVLQWANRWTFPQALEAVAGHLGIREIHSTLISAPPALPVPVPENGKRRKLPLALWESAVPDTGRISEYMRYRGLSGNVPPSLRLNPALTYYEGEAPTALYPAMLARVLAPNGELVSIHRTFLDSAGPGKAPVLAPKKLTSPITEGATKGAAIRLFEAGETLAVCEGIETCMAVREATGTPAWAAISANGLEVIEIPAGVKRVEIWADNDVSGTGQTAARKAAERLGAAGLDVRIFVPDQVGKDWLDVLVEQGPKALQTAQTGSPAEPAPPKPSTHWPDPPDPVAFHGLAGDWIRAIAPHTEADEMGLLVQFLITFGNLIGRRAHSVAEADKHYTNLFAVLVGQTAKGRKGSSWGQIKRAMQKVDDEWTGERVQHGLSSGEGLIWTVRDPIFRMDPVKERGRVVDYEQVMVDPGIEDKRVLILESEFASTLKVLSREGNTLSATVRNAWDMGNLRALTKNSPAKATGAHISIVGHITQDELLRYLDSTEAGNGFGNRFLWVCVQRSKILPEGGKIDEADLSPLEERLKETVKFAKEVDRIQRDEQARAIWYEVYPELSEGKPGLFGALTARADPQVMRLSTLYALLDLSSTVRKEHLRAALAVWEYCEASVRCIFGDALGDPTADTILRALRERPTGVTRTQISDLFGQHKQGEQIARALMILAERGLARQERVGTGGRTAEVWFAADRGEKKGK